MSAVIPSSPYVFALLSFWRSFAQFKRSIMFLNTWTEKKLCNFSRERHNPYKVLSDTGHAQLNPVSYRARGWCWLETRCLPFNWETNTELQDSPSKHPLGYLWVSEMGWKQKRSKTLQTMGRQSLWMGLVNISCLALPFPKACCVPRNRERDGGLQLAEENIIPLLG